MQCELATHDSFSCLEAAAHLDPGRVGPRGTVCIPRLVLMNEACTVVALPVSTLCTLGLPSVVHIFQMSCCHGHRLQHVLRNGTVKLEGAVSKTTPISGTRLQVWESPRPPLASAIHGKPTELTGSWYTRGCVLLQLKIQTKMDQGKCTGWGPGKFQTWSLRLSFLRSPESRSSSCEAVWQ